MEYLTYEGNNQNKIENFLLGVYDIYYLNMIVKAIRLDWDSWVGIALTAILSFCWTINLSKYKTYEFRARFTAIMMQISLLIYASQLDGVLVMLPVFIAFVVLFGLYGIADIINTTVVSAIVLFFYHGIIANTLPFETWTDKLLVFVQIGNVFFVEYIVYLWTKRNSEGSRKLLGMLEEMKAVESRKDDFLANVSHEIRTPINTICGLSEILLKEDLTEKTKADVQGIQLAGRNLMSVVRDILDFSELQSGKIALEEEAYNITSTVNDIINMAMVRKKEKKLELIVDCDANIPCALLGDEKKIRRVIMNLVDNAIKFTEQGCVSITVGYRKEAYGINLIITVKDTGIGMDAESLEKLFVSFNQVDGSRRRQEGGIGLGLAISRVLAQKLGATITMKSKVGKGSTVKFVIPQKVLDETPIAAIQDRQNVKVATYIDMEQFDIIEIRDEYSKMIVNMVKQLRGNCHICRNFAELQRRQEKEHFSHIFISIVEYQAETEYFDELAKKTKVIVVLDRWDEKYVTNSQILKIHKPFYILTIVSVLNGGSEAGQAEIPVYMEKFTTRDAHVMVVDDNRMNLRVMEGLLAHYNIRTTIATSGKEALEKINSSNYDFVFMDHMMPEMDGVETMQQIRHKVGTYFQKVPIVALTANAVAGARELLLEKGFDDFLEKPVERSVLERVLKRNLPDDKLIFKEVADEKNVADDDANDVVKDGVVEMEETQTNMNLENELETYGLDTQKGILYCGDKECYIEILQEYCETYKETEASATQLFETEDWQNYTIVVHGMKSSLRSIGATEVSGLAAKLEKAGKEGQIDYIVTHHQAFLEAYHDLFGKLCKVECLAPAMEIQSQEAECEVVELPVLESSEFEQKLVELEDAAYALDGKRQQEIIMELQKYQYCGASLKELLVPAQKKVEKSDYISAYEMIERIKDKLTHKEG